MTDRYQLVPASYVLLLRPAQPGGPDAEEVLLQLRANTGFMDGHWAAAAAGHVEAGEGAVAAAVREAAEEIGVTVDPADLVPLTAVHRTLATGDPLDERVDFFFTCRRWTGEPHTREPDRSAGLDWFPLDALPAETVPHERAVLEALLAERRGGADVAAVRTYGY
ncbi:NUDIX domain-containing protein [Pseudonocardia phyllosphaerae]|uniref:NUDIX domain-containing protein n=1 Tax=Pseudonocardia phyllosphaerae TaxID=3390502 RepID=UPI00397D70A0